MIHIILCETIILISLLLCKQFCTAYNNTCAKSGKLCKFISSCYNLTALYQGKVGPQPSSTCSFDTKVMFSFFS